jgi:hypothetical protein
MRSYHDSNVYQILRSLWNGLSFAGLCFLARKSPALELD